jgi:Hydroxymethylglutaryl-coenzyme A synthase N terminal
MLVSLASVLSLPGRPLLSAWTGTLNISRIGGRQNQAVLLSKTIHVRLQIRQSELEQYDGVPTGKYTVGLGQECMAFCGDNEDVVWRRPKSSPVLQSDGLVAA